ncbi:hypothetical protein A8L34_23175 [Bacillus sp. FJAT-27264]|uniref:hypothetical protein n=1 Tax=Paenibacillus sp. (strain DSM 101736 / FJAT-27264) TaxID=1850362 RepID=UPI000807AD35|nr:hypothetical protein [Bacillus sp. FJAT-27264]OBZ09051.1 hypothetical protein A8L34_23175 [Bacillus sp. FJAT-27264]
MRSNKKPLVISIAAVSGGGKTTMVKELNNKLVNSNVLYFDNYDFDGPDDICEWIENGANVNDWILTPLVSDLKILLSEHRQSVEYILLDYPFAYLHNEMIGLIDFTIFIDTPLDVAMARRILRDYSDRPIQSVLEDASNYLSRGRVAYLEMLNTVKPHSDFIVDGSLPVHEIVNKLLKIILDKKKI